MTTLEALQNRERCLEYLEGCKARANPECVEAVRLSVIALREKQEMENRKQYTPPIAEILPGVRWSCEDANTLYLDFPGGKRHIFRDGEYAGWYMP